MKVGSERRGQGVGAGRAGDVRVQATVLVVGAADRAAITETSRSIRGLMAAGVRDLVVDVSAAQDVDGRLLTVLARTRAQLGADAGNGPHGGSLTVLGVALPQFLAALQGASLDEVFVIYDAVRRATPVRVPPPRRGAPRQQPRLCREPSLPRAGAGDEAVAQLEPVPSVPVPSVPVPSVPVPSL